MKDKIRSEVMKVFDQEADVDTVVDNILLLVSNSLPKQNACTCWRCMGLEKDPVGLFPENEIKQTVIDVLNILEEKQDSYIDPAEHIYDGMKSIRRHLDDEDLIRYVGDFIWALDSDVNGDFDGTLAKCVEMLRSLV